MVEKIDMELQAVQNLNASQRSAMLMALTRTCTIVQGPPGTGKTHVAVGVLRLMIKSIGTKPLLAVSDSNVAVDNMAAGLQALGVKVVRLGRPEKVRSQLDLITLESHLRQEKDKAAREEEEKKQQEKEKDAKKNDKEKAT